MGRSLLDDEEGGQGEDFTLKVNSKYAARLEVRARCRACGSAMHARRPHSLSSEASPLRPRAQHNKRREELHRLQEKHPEVAARLAAGGAESADSSSEDDSVRGCRALTDGRSRRAAPTRPHLASAHTGCSAASRTMELRSPRRRRASWTCWRA